MSILFINGSPNQKGTTAQLAATLLEGKPYETVNLVDYKVYSYGQKFEAVRNLLDRFYGPVKQGALSEKNWCLFSKGERRSRGCLKNRSIRLYALLSYTV